MRQINYKFVKHGGGPPLDSRHLTGFTLVEVLIAISLVAVGIWLMMNAFIKGSEGIIAARRRIEGLHCAQEVMEDYVISKEFDDFTIGTQSLSGSNNFSRSYTVWYVDSSDLETDDESGTTDLKRIRVTVSDNNDKIADITLDTLKTNFQKER